MHDNHFSESPWPQIEVDSLALICRQGINNKLRRTRVKFTRLKKQFQVHAGRL